jgi:hypothetical protein
MRQFEGRRLGMGKTTVLQRNLRRSATIAAGFIALKICFGLMGVEDPGILTRAYAQDRAERNGCDPQSKKAEDVLKCLKQLKVKPEDGQKSFAPEQGAEAQKGKIIEQFNEQQKIDALKNLEKIQ